MAEVRGMEEDLDGEDDLGETDTVMGEETGDLESRPRTWSTLVPISPSIIILRISTIGLLP